MIHWTYVLTVLLALDVAFCLPFALALGGIHTLLFDWGKRG